eukprot:1110807-Pelagomonas_calceolata.AAC.1
MEAACPYKKQRKGKCLWFHQRFCIYTRLSLPRLEEKVKAKVYAGQQPVCTEEKPNSHCWH